MRKHLHLLGLTLLVAAQTAFAGNHFQSKLQSLKNKAVPVAVLGSNAQAKIAGLSTRAKLAPAQALQKASVEAVQSQAYGFLIGPDNKDWYYTMDFQINENSYYDGADVKVYDSSNELRGTFSVKVPEASWWQSEFTLCDGVITHRENDSILNNWETDKGSNYSVKLTPGQKIRLNFAAGTGVVE